MPLQIGEKIPDLTGTDQNGAEIRTAQFRGQYLIVFFYPRDGTAVCTKEACLFRDAYEDLLADEAAVVGVSSNSLASHRSFAESQRLPFPLISDADGAWRAGFGVPNMLWLIPRRVTFLIDPAGTVRHVVDSLLNAEVHVRETRDALKSLRGQSGPTP